MATCDRFGLPAVFASILVASLDGGLSRVRTADGLTDPISILTSVRQGDPLAAIAFVLVMDALHAGFKQNPLAHGSEVLGYPLDGNGSPTVFSCGYADDTLTPSSSWSAAKTQHMWVLDFFTAHHLRLNSRKSYCCVGSGIGLSDVVCGIADACDAASARARDAISAAEAWFEATIQGRTLAARIARSACYAHVAAARASAKLASVDPPINVSPDVTRACVSASEAAWSIGSSVTTLRDVVKSLSAKKSPPLPSGSLAPIGAILGSCWAADGAAGALKWRCSELRSLPDIDEARVHDPADGRPAPTHMLVLPYPLTSPDIVTRPASYPFRYLGYMLSIDLGSAAVVSSLSGRVWSAVRRIRADHMDLVESSDFLREFVYPRLELGLMFGSVPTPVLSSWDSLIGRAVLGTNRSCNVSSVTRPALYMALGIPPLLSYASMVAATELGGTLRDVPDGMHSMTTRARLKSGVRSGHLSTERRIIAGETWVMVTGVKRCRSNRVARVLDDLRRAGILVSYRLGPTPPGDLGFTTMPPVDARVGCPVLRTTLSSFLRLKMCPPVPGGCRPVSVYTDGGFGRNASGYGVVLCLSSASTTSGFRFCPATCVVLSGGSPRSGANYSAECAAIIVALRSLPVNCPVLCVSDALSAMQSVSSGLIPASKRVRLGARAFIVTCRKLINIRANHGGTTTFRHVFSHTEQLSVDARGNDAADTVATTASKDPQFQQERDTPFLAGEEDFVFWEVKDRDEWHVSGDLRSLLKARAMSSLLISLQRKTTQGDVAREAGPALLSQFTMVRKVRDAGLLLFLLLASTKQTHTADRLVWPASSRSPAVMLCPLCHRSPQSASHCFSCVSVRHLMRSVRVTASSEALRIAGPVLASSSPVHSSAVRRFCVAADWCNPTRHPQLDLSGDGVTLTGRLSSYAGLLGILPPELTRLLCPAPSSLGARECTHKSLRRSYVDGLASLRLRTLQTARIVYEGWCGHSVGRWRPPVRCL